MEEFIGIPWGKVFTHFLWISGAALILADLSYHEFLSHHEKISCIHMMKRTSFVWIFQSGFILITISFCVLFKSHLLSGIAGVAALIQIFILIRSRVILRNRKR